MMPILQAPYNRQTILIVDDTPANLRMLVNYLEELGFDILTAQDGEEALQRAQFMQPDLILLDVMMPDIDGLETCRRLKQVASVKDIPVIFMSALTDTGKKIDGFKAGGVDYITKPFQIEEVLARITTHLNFRIMHMQLTLQNLQLQYEITERARLDERMRIASLVYQNSSEAMLVVDTENRILAINPAFTRITGYSADEVGGQQSSLFNPQYLERAAHLEMMSALHTTGHWEGELWDQRKDGAAYPQWMVVNTLKNDAGAKQGYVVLFSDITEKKKSAELIWRQANFDELTGLPNRRMFHERLQQEMKNQRRAGRSLALFFIDLDHFKEINDTLGHKAGDQLLVEAARRITARTRATDIVARLGGDEFIVVLTQVDELNAVEGVAQVIIDSLAQPFTLGKELAYISASVGISMYLDPATSAAQLLNNADQAMYLAKSRGGNCFSHFTSLLQDAALSRRRLINDLHSALEHEQFELVFQPIVDLTSGRVHQAEALVRWRHPERGLLGPADFLPIAEETGMIIAIGDLILRSVTRWLTRWLAMGLDDLQISINISPVQFKKEAEGHELHWLDYLADNGLAGRHIVLDITESLLLSANSHIADKLRQFRAAGIQIAIDDFGTGYSSLAHLKKFALDYLKIDHSFVANLATHPHDRTLVEAIIAMAHKLDLKVIAEGVETEPQRALLADAACDYAQGYLFASPMTPEALEKLLQDGASSAVSAPDFVLS